MKVCEESKSGIWEKSGGEKPRSDVARQAMLEIENLKTIAQNAIQQLTSLAEELHDGVQDDDCFDNDYLTPTTLSPGSSSCSSPQFLLRDSPGPTRSDPGAPKGRLDGRSYAHVCRSERAGTDPDATREAPGCDGGDLAAAPLRPHPALLRGCAPAARPDITPSVAAPEHSRGTSSASLVRGESREHVLCHGSGVYCYLLPELQVVEITAVDGSSQLCNEYVVLKVGKTEVYSGGFLKRIERELQDVRGWWCHDTIPLSKRLVFLLSGAGVSGFEMPVISHIGTNVGRASVDCDRSMPTLQRVLAADSSNTWSNILFKERRNLKVGHGWRLWLSRDGKTPRIGPTELVVVHRDAVAALRREFAASPAAFDMATFLRVMHAQPAPAIRAVSIDFVNPDASLGPLHFITGGSPIGEKPRLSTAGDIRAARRPWHD